MAAKELYAMCPLARPKATARWPFPDAITCSAAGSGSCMAQHEEAVPGVDLGEVGRHGFSPPIAGDYGAHDAALGNIRRALVQGVKGVMELGRAGGEIYVQPFLFQEAPGHGDVDRRVEHRPEGLHEPQRLSRAGQLSPGWLLPKIARLGLISETTGAGPRRDC